MQAYFFPYIGYFQLIHAVDRFILYAHVKYIRNGWIHRNRILIKNREPQFIQVPLTGKTFGVDVDLVRMKEPGTPWRRKLLQTLHHNYARSPAFDETFPLLTELINLPTSGIHEYNSTIVTGIAAHLGLKTEIVSDPLRFLDIEKQLLHDSAANGEPDGLDRRMRRIIALCRHESADSYTNPSAARCSTTGKSCGGMELTCIF
jgi:hypothetical protein